MFTGKESISVSNKFKSVSDKSLSKRRISDKSKANLRLMQDVLNATVLISIASETQIAFLLEDLKSLATAWCCEISRTN